MATFLGLVLVVLVLYWALRPRRRAWDGVWRPHRHYGHRHYANYWQPRYHYRALAISYAAAYLAGGRDATGCNVVTVDRDVLVDGFLEVVGNPHPGSPEHEAATVEMLKAFDIICRSRVS